MDSLSRGASLKYLNQTTQFQYIPSKVFEMFKCVGCTSLQSRLVGMNPVQIRAAMELYPDIRPTHRPSGQGLLDGECCFNIVSIAPNSYQESAEQSFSLTQTVKPPWLKKSMRALAPGLRSMQTNRGKGMLALYTELYITFIRCLFFLEPFKAAVDA